MHVHTNRDACGARLLKETMSYVRSVSRMHDAMCAALVMWRWLSFCLCFYTYAFLHFVRVFFFFFYIFIFFFFFF